MYPSPPAVAAVLPETSSSPSHSLVDATDITRLESELQDYLESDTFRHSDAYSLVAKEVRDEETTSRVRNHIDRRISHCRTDRARLAKVSPAYLKGCILRNWDCAPCTPCYNDPEATCTFDSRFKLNQKCKTCASDPEKSSKCDFGRVASEYVQERECISEPVEKVEEAPSTVELIVSFPQPQVNETIRVLDKSTHQLSTPVLQTPVPGSTFGWSNDTDYPQGSTPAGYSDCVSSNTIDDPYMDTATGHTQQTSLPAHTLTEVPVTACQEYPHLYSYPAYPGLLQDDAVQDTWGYQDLDSARLGGSITGPLMTTGQEHQYQGFNKPHLGATTGYSVPHVVPGSQASVPSSQELGATDPLMIPRSNHHPLGVQNPSSNGLAGYDFMQGRPGSQASDLWNQGGYASGPSSLLKNNPHSLGFVSQYLEGPLGYNSQHGAPGHEAFYPSLRANQSVYGTSPPMTLVSQLEPQGSQGLFPGDPSRVCVQPVDASFQTLSPTNLGGWAPSLPMTTINGNGLAVWAFQGPALGGSRGNTVQQDVPIPQVFYPSLQGDWTMNPDINTQAPQQQSQAVVHTTCGGSTEYRLSQGYSGGQSQ